MFLTLPGILIFLGIPTVILLKRRLSKLYGYPSTELNGTTLLKYSPSRLEKLDIVAIVLQVLLKYIPWYGTPRLTLHSDRVLLDVPVVRLSGPLQVTEEDLDTFRCALGYSSTSAEETRVNPLFLVAVTTPLVILTLTHRKSPIKVLGAVNTKNRFVFHHPETCTSTKQIIDASQKGELVFTAEMGGANSGRIRKRGVEVELVICVFHNTKPILTQHCSFLQFAKMPPSALTNLTTTVPPAPGTTQITSSGIPSHSTVTIPGNAPLRWAAITRDYNLIHVSSLAAKLFGFRSAIAHGNHVAALLVESCLSLAAEELATDCSKQMSDHKDLTALMALWFGLASKTFVGNTDLEKETTMDVTFVKPVTPLPARLDVEWTEGSRLVSAKIAHNSAEDVYRRIEFNSGMNAKWCVVGSLEQRQRG